MWQKLKFLLAISLLFQPLFSFATDYFYLGHTQGKGLGYRRGYTTIGLFLASPTFATPRFQPFVDTKVYFFNEGKWAASVGGGNRYLFPSTRLVLGANVYYDYRKIRQFDLNQIGMGLELLTPRWEFRVNGYIPVGKRNFREARLYDFSDNFFAIRQKRVSAWYGVDAEIGTWMERKGLYVAAGPYYYFRDDAKGLDNRKHHHALGGRIRLLAKIDDDLDFTLLATHDPLWHTAVQVQITVALPFHCCRSSTSRCSCTCVRQMAIQPVQRNEIIAADQECYWLWNWSDGCGCDCDSSYYSPSCSHSIHFSSFSFSDRSDQ